MISGLTYSWNCLMTSWSAMLTAALTEVNVRLERRLYRGSGVDLSSLFGKLWEGDTLSSSLSLSYNYGLDTYRSEERRVCVQAIVV